MTFNDFLKTHKVNGYVLCDVNSIHHLSDQEIQLLEETWNAAINSAREHLLKGYWFWDTDCDDKVAQIAYENGEYCMLPEDELKKLLTSK